MNIYSLPRDKVAELEVPKQYRELLNHCRNKTIADIRFEQFMDFVMADKLYPETLNVLIYYFEKEVHYPDTGITPNQREYMRLLMEQASPEMLEKLDIDDLATLSRLDASVTISILKTDIWNKLL